MPTLNIVGRYRGWGDLDLEGTREDLRVLARVIETTEHPTTLDLAVPKMEAAPYAGFLRTLRLADLMGQVQVRREGDSLHILGAMEQRKFLADSIRFLAEGEDAETGIRPHIHIEFIAPGWPPPWDWLSPSSEPLVVSLRT